MASFQTEFEPVALPDQAIRILPEDEVRLVEAVEQVAQIGPIDIVAEASAGTIAANGDVGSSDPVNLEELEMRNDQLGQFRLQPLSNIRVEVRQVGNEARRFHTAGQVSELSPMTDPNKQEIFVFEDKEAQVIVRNTNSYELQKALIAATGFKFLLSEPVQENQVSGQPVAVPTSSLETQAQTRFQEGASAVDRRSNAAGGGGF